MRQVERKIGGIPVPTLSVGTETYHSTAIETMIAEGRPIKAPTVSVGKESEDQSVSEPTAGLDSTAAARIELLEIKQTELDQRRKKELPPEAQVEAVAVTYEEPHIIGRVENLMDRLLGKEKVAAVVDRATDTIEKRERLVGLKRFFQKVVLAGGVIGLTIFGWTKWGERWEDEVQEKAQIKGWTSILIDPSSIEAMDSVLYGHLTPGVNPDFKTGWEGTSGEETFGEEAGAIGKVIELSLTPDGRDTLKDDYGDRHNIKPFLDWASDKSYLDYWRLREDYFKGVLGVNEKDLEVLDELWQTYIYGEGDLKGAIQSSRQSSSSLTPRQMRERALTQSQQALVSGQAKQKARTKRSS